MNWFYESGGSQQGPVSEADLDRLLAEGKITGDTLVWREGMAGWTPHRVARAAQAAAAPDPDYEVTRPATPIGQSPVAATSPFSPGTGATIPASAAGGSETPQPGWIQCSYTGRYFPPSEIIYIEGRAYSAAAKPQVLAILTSGQVLPDISADRDGPPWEHRERLGVWRALVETVKLVLLQPAQCFASMRRHGLVSALLFWLLTAGIGMVVGQIYGLAFQGAMLSALKSSGAASTQFNPMLAMQAAFGISSVVLVPVFYGIILFVQAGLTHLMLMALKAANQPFETTFRVMAYGFGATGTLHLIPICGSMVAGLWGLVAICMGLGPAQNTTTGKSVAAVLLPLLVCCIAVAGVYALIIGAVVAGASSRGR